MAIKLGAKTIRLHLRCGQNARTRQSHESHRRRRLQIPRLRQTRRHQSHTQSRLKTPTAQIRLPTRRQRRRLQKRLRAREHANKSLP